METTKDNKIRKTQVYTQSSPRRTGIYSIDPQIRLCGEWLKKAGFEAGDHIKIITTKCLVIVPDEKKQEDL